MVTILAEIAVTGPLLHTAPLYDYSWKNWLVGICDKNYIHIAQGGHGGQKILFGNHGRKAKMRL